MKTLQLQPSKNTQKSFIKYAIAGGLASLVEYGTFFIFFKELNITLIVANGLSFCLGLTTAFLLNRVWAFRTPTADNYSKKAHHQFGLYIVLAVINLFLTIGVVSVLKHFGVNPLVGKLFAMTITSVWNFVLLKFLIFNRD